jgi:hypothetical protein
MSSTDEFTSAVDALADAADLMREAIGYTDGTPGISSRRIGGMKVTVLPSSGGIVIPDGMSREEFNKTLDALVEAVDLMTASLAEYEDPIEP